MNHEQQLVLAKAAKKKENEKLSQAEHIAKKSAEYLQSSISDLRNLLSEGLSFNNDDITSFFKNASEFGQSASDLIHRISIYSDRLAQLDIPESIELKQIVDHRLLEKLDQLGADRQDQTELLNKFQQLDVSLNILTDILKAPKEKQGQKPQDYIPVRVVDDIDGKLTWFKSNPAPVFFNPGSSSGGGLTDEQLRASPVPVTGELTATVDTTGLSTEAKQDTLIGHVDNVETLLSNIQALTNIVYTKPTDTYSIQAISDDGTYKYYFYEAANLDWYIMRKHITNNVYTYTKGNSGYTSVYQSSILGPSGTPIWDTYGATF